MSDRPVRVVLVDDDDLMRAGLKAVLSSDPSVQVVGEAGDGSAAVTRVLELEPDVVLMDVRMPHLDGIAATREVHARRPDAKVVILTTPELGRSEMLDELTPREREVLLQLARGLSNTEIADALVIEESTVKTHVKRILMKLNLRDRVHAVIFAYEHGLTRPGPKSRASSTRAPPEGGRSRSLCGGRQDPASGRRRMTSRRAPCCS